MRFSVIVPSRDVNSNLLFLVNEVLKINNFQIEIIILVDSYALNPWQENNKVKFIALNSYNPGQKRDFGAQIATGEVLVFLDDDSYPRFDFFIKLQRNLLNLSELEVAIGGPGITPIHSSISQKVSGAFYEFAGTDSEKARYKSIYKHIQVDDWPTVNLSIYRNAFNTIGGFETNHWPGEDTYFCNKLILQGYKIKYCPDVIVYHQRRRNLLEHLKQISGYGFHRGLFAKSLKGNSIHLKYFYPTIFVLYLFAIFIFSLINKSILHWSLFIGIFLYLLSVISFSIYTTIKIDIRTILKSPIYFSLSHIMYGVQFLNGYMRSTIKSLVNR
jgi:GT2 family glycosyltransferase